MLPTDICVKYVSIFYSAVTFVFFLASPLSCGVVDLIALTATYCDGVKRLEGTQGYAGDGHEVRGKHHQDSLGVVKCH